MYKTCRLFVVCSYYIRLKAHAEFLWAHYIRDHSTRLLNSPYRSSRHTMLEFLCQFPANPPDIRVLTWFVVFVSRAWLAPILLCSCAVYYAEKPRTILSLSRLLYQSLLLRARVICKSVNYVRKYDIVR